MATILAKAAALNQRYDVSADHSEKQQILRHLFARIVVMPEMITFEVRLGGLVTLLGCASGPDTDPIPQEEDGGRIVPISFPVQMKRWGVEGKFVLQGSTTEPASKDPMLIGLIAKLTRTIDLPMIWKEQQFLPDS